jgi:hypothetical protein
MRETEGAAALRIGEMPSPQTLPACRRCRRPGSSSGFPGFVPDVRRSLLNAEPSRSVLLFIHDEAPAERLQIRWRSALRVCASLLGGRPWRVVSLAPLLEQGAP